jgi:hypothetical protein
MRTRGCTTIRLVRHDRSRRIDLYIDYFGDAFGGAAGPSQSAAGHSLLEVAGLHAMEQPFRKSASPAPEQARGLR